MDNKEYKNKHVEDFILNTVHKIEGLPMDQCAWLLYRYYQEACNPEKFPSSAYDNQDDRIDDMFKGAPEPVKNFLKLKSYQHQLKKSERDGVKDEEKEKFNKNRVEELVIVVSESEYAEFVTLIFWVP